MKNMLRFIVVVMFSVILFSSIVENYAQNKSKPTDDTLYYSMEDVVVIGTRTAKKIIDIPYPVLHIGAQEFKYARNNSIDDAINTIPGVYISSRYGNHDVKVSIRGFGSRSNSGIRGVRMLLDGIPESEPDGQTRIEAIDLNAIGNIEIVKGNASSLYTNAPGGAINFISDINFVKPFASLYSEFGSFDLKRSGFKAGYRDKNYGMMLAYTNHYYTGYRAHSKDYWDILNTVFESTPNDYSRLQIFGYYANGIIRLPGSLTRAQFDANPYQPQTNESTLDYLRNTKKGRLGVRFNTQIGEARNNEFEVIGYTAIKYFERIDKNYRIMNRYGFGGSTKWVNKSTIIDQNNEFTIGGDVYYQTGPVENYVNLGGLKGDKLNEITNESIINTGLYLQNIYDIIPNKLSLLLSGRYDKIIFDSKNNGLSSANSVRTMEFFAPKAALNYKFTSAIATYVSYGLGFDTPAANELANYPSAILPNPDDSKLLNPTLNPQKSTNFEIGLKGSWYNSGAHYFSNFVWEVSFFNYQIQDEIVPFSVNGTAFYRNAAKTNRTGLEIGGQTSIFNGLSLKVAYTYSSFKYDNYNAKAWALDKNGNWIINENDYTGKMVPSVPKSNFAANLTYDRPITETISGFIKFNYQNLSEMFVDDSNSDKAEGYSLLNASIGTEINFNKFRVTAIYGLNNIADTKYVAFLNINDANSRFFEVGAPRNYFASINIGYNF